MAQAREDASSLRTAWRLRYDMPPTDPRFLAATDDMMLEDLLAQHFAREEADAVKNPRAAVQKAVRDLGGQEATARFLDRLRDSLAAQDAARAAASRTSTSPGTVSPDRAGGAQRRKGTVKP